MTDRHRELANDIHARLKTANSLDEYELRKIGGEIYDVMNWLKGYEIITQSRVGMPFTKGKYFYTYKTLDDLLNPQTAQTQNVKVEIGQLQNITDSTINAPITQSSASDIKETVNTFENKASNKSNMTTNIIYPIIVGVILIIIALILKYGFNVTY
jgi:hypothetical protein